MKNRSRYFILQAGLLFTFLMLLFFIYSNFVKDLSYRNLTLKKSSDLILPSPTNKNILSTKHNKNIIPTIKSLAKDTTRHKILLVGDSQVEGLKLPFYDYCFKNNHKIMAAFTWFAGTDMAYADSDTLKNVINKYKPDYIVMVIGLNELYKTRLEECTIAVKKILTTFNNIPYSWIGPANWTEDKGINNMYESTVDEGCFFLSKNLNLPRGKDERHPNEIGYNIWMDSIALWMNTKAYWHLNMLPPDSVIKNKKINDLYILAK